MKNNYLTIGVTMVLLLLPFLLFGAETPPTPVQQDYNKLLQFLKGDGAFEQWFMQVFVKMDTKMYAESSNARALGQALGGIGAFIYLGYLGFQMQEGARPWEVTPMIKPIIIGFILINWTSFVSMIERPFAILSEPSANVFSQVEKEVNDVRITRFKMQNQVLDALIKKRAEEEASQQALDQAQNNSDTNMMGDLLGDGIDGLMAPIREWFLRFDFSMQRTVSEIIEGVGLTILRVCTYLIFFIQKIWIYVLIVLGPIAVGISLIPGFDTSMYNWLAKFININLYTFIAYTIINIGQQLIVTGYEMSIDRYKLMIDSNGAVLDLTMLETFVANDGMIYLALYPVTAYIVTGIGVLMTPSIADAIVSASSAHIMGKAKAGAGTVVGGAKTVAQTVATKGANLPSAIARGMNNSSASGMVNSAMNKGK